MNADPRKTADRIAAEWDRNADVWAACVQYGGDPINEVFGIPSFLDYLGPLANLKVLDAGCGEGRSARHLAARGAQVTGVDVSPGMLARAAGDAAEAQRNIAYVRASCAGLGAFRAGSFDLVVSFMALMDMPELPRVMAELYRVTRSGGRLAIAVRHPCHFTAGYSLLKAPDGSRAGLKIANYFRGRPYKARLQLAGRAQGDFVVTRFAYTLSDYVGALLRSGFALTSLVEPRPTEAMCDRLPFLDFWRRHGALYLFLAGAKP